MNNMPNLSELRSVVDEALESGRFVCLSPETVDFLLDLAERAHSGAEKEDSQ